MSSLNSSVVCRTNSPLKFGLLIPRRGSANIAKDLPPPAAPPYSTSRSEEAKKSVCGPAFGLNSTSGSTSVGSGRTIGVSGSCAIFGGEAIDGLFFKLLDFINRFFEPSGKLTFNCNCFLTSFVNFYSFS